MESLQALYGLFVQSNRVIDLTFGASTTGGPSANELLPQRVVFTEGLSRPYQLDLYAITLNHAIELKSLLGVPVAVRLRADQGERMITGLVTQSRYLGTEAGFTGIALRIEPALALLAHRRASRIFQDRDVPDIVATLVQEHQRRNEAMAASWALQVSLRKTYPVHSYLVQYQETDLAFIQRILALEGIHYRFTFAATDGVCKHTLVLFDDNASLPASPVPVLDYRQSTDGQGTLTGWRAQRQLTSSRTSHLTYDYKPAQAVQSDELTGIEQGAHGQAAGSSLEDYRSLSPYAAGNQDTLRRYAALHQQARDVAAKTFHGEASVPLVAGTHFRLDDHPAHAQDSDEQRTFVVTGVDLTATNNFPAELARQLSPALLDLETAGAATDATAWASSLADPRVTTHFSAVRQAIALVPGDAEQLHAPPSPGVQTATVVGPPGEVIHTDELGRIRVQMHWQRVDEHPDGGANWDAQSSTWVRYAHPGASEGFGSQSLPRIGDEVVIVFQDNDPSRPLAIASVHNGPRGVPRFSGVGTLPGNKTLTGAQSREHQGSGYSEWLFDDTPGQVRTRLATTTGASELNLGYLTTPRTDGQAQARGQGAELRTDAAAALRAAQGMLLTTYARQQAQGHQLDRAELDQLLAQCAELFKALGDYAGQHGGQAPDPAGQTALTDALKSWPSGNDAGGQGQPVMALAAAEGLLSATPKSHVSYAGENIDTVAQQHLQLTAGQRASLHAGRGLDLFAQADGLRAIANQGQVQVQAQADDLVMQSAKDIHLAAVGDVFLHGTRLHLVAADGSYHTIGGGHELGSNSALTVKTSEHTFTGPATQSSQPPTFGKEGTDQKFQLHYPGHTEDAPRVAAQQKYRLTLDDGRVIEGVSDAQGRTQLVKDQVMRLAKIDILDPDPL